MSSIRGANKTHHSTIMIFKRQRNKPTTKNMSFNLRNEKATSQAGSPMALIANHKSGNLIVDRGFASRTFHENSPLHAASKPQLSKIRSNFQPKPPLPLRKPNNRKKRAEKTQTEMPFPCDAQSDGIVYFALKTHCCKSALEKQHIVNKQNKRKKKPIIFGFLRGSKSCKMKSNHSVSIAVDCMFGLLVHFAKRLCFILFLLDISAVVVFVPCVVCLVGCIVDHKWRLHESPPNRTVAVWCGSADAQIEKPIALRNFGGDCIRNGNSSFECSNTFSLRSGAAAAVCHSSTLSRSHHSSQHTKNNRSTTKARITVFLDKSFITSLVVIKHYCKFITSLAARYGRRRRLRRHRWNKLVFIRFINSAWHRQRR